MHSSTNFIAQVSKGEPTDRHKTNQSIVMCGPYLESDFFIKLFLKDV